MKSLQQLQRDYNIKIIKSKWGVIKILRDYEFRIEGHPYIFTTKIDFKILYRDWGLEVPARTTKQMKIDILKKTREKFTSDKEGLRYKYWDKLCEHFGVPEVEELKLF